VSDVTSSVDTVLAEIDNSVNITLVLYGGNLYFNNTYVFSDGVHTIRNALGTELYKAGVDIYALNTFGRWSLAGLGTGARYIKVPKQLTDAKVLEVHPFVQTWREALELRSDISLFAKRDFCPLTRFFLYGRVV